MDRGRKWLVDFNARKTQLVLFNQCNNTGAIDVKMDGFVLKEKSSFKMLGWTFSPKLDWGLYIISIAKTSSKKIGALICSMKFLSPKVTLYLYRYTIRPCMEYCCHISGLEKLHARSCLCTYRACKSSLKYMKKRVHKLFLS